MNPALNDLPTRGIASDQARQAKNRSSGRDRSKMWREKGLTSIAPFVLALLPIASFLGQLWFSYQEGTQVALFHHLTVTIVDWVFVPFNYFVARVIDWRHGGRIYLIACFSILMNVVTHAFWQYNGLDGGHMINKAGVFLPAGWIHLAFSSIEMVLLVAFIFCRKSVTQAVGLTTILASLYFLTMGACGYAMHHAFIASDVIVLVCGLFFTLIYPQLFQSRRCA